LCFSKKR